MSTISASARTRQGGAWILEDATDIFTPERMTDEHRMIARTASDFINQEVLTQLDRLEAKDWALNRTLVQRCGELGLLGTDAPESYGGVELDKVSSVIVAENIARCASFGTTFGAMTGLSVMPLLGWGTE